MAQPSGASPIDASVTFDDSRMTSEKPSFEKSRSSSRSRYESELGGPDGIATRNNSNVAPDEDMPQALRALSVASEPAAPAPDEPRWPTNWRAYTTWLGGFILMFNSWGIVNAYGTYASYYRQHLMPDANNTLLNLIGSTQCFCVLGLSIVVGRFIDAGYIRTLITIGSVLIILGQFLLTLATGAGDRGHGNYALIWTTQGLCTGLGMACYFVTSSAVAATWFKQTKSFCIGVVASGASIAGLVYPIMLKFLIADIGFNNAQRAVAALTSVLSIIVIFIAQPNPATTPRKPTNWRGWFDVRIFWDKQAFKDSAFCWQTAAIAFLFWGFYPIFFNLEEWAAYMGLGYKDETPAGAASVTLGAKEVQNDAIRVFYMLAIMNGTSTVGRMSSGLLSDKFGALLVHCIVTFVSSLLVLCVWTTTTTVNQAIAFVVVFGMFSGAVIGLPPASMAWILNFNDPIAQQKLGQWVGMMYTIAAIPALTGPIIAGELITRFNNNYLTVQVWSGACLFISACCMLIALFYAERKRDKKWTTIPGRKLSEATTSMSFLSRNKSRGISEKEEV